MTKLVTFIALVLASSNLFAKSLPKHTSKVAKSVYSYGDSAKGYFSMFTITKKGVVVFESVNTKHSQGLLKAIRGITKKPILYLLQSHNHWDHTGGGKVFRDEGAKIVVHSEAYEWMKANPNPDMVLPDDHWAGDKKIMNVGGKVIELHYFGMNHGLGMTIFLLPKEKITYIADIVTPNRLLFTIVPDFNIKEWERSLGEILKLDFNKAIFSHNMKSDPLLGGNKSDIQDTISYIKDLRSAIHAEFKKGTNPMTIPDVVKVPKYKDWAMYKEWLPMNAWRVMLDEWMGPFPWRAEPAK